MRSRGRGDHRARHGRLAARRRAHRARQEQHGRPRVTARMKFLHLHHWPGHDHPGLTLVARHACYLRRGPRGAQAENEGSGHQIPACRLRRKRVGLGRPSAVDQRATNPTPTPRGPASTSSAATAAAFDVSAFLRFGTTSLVICGPSGRAPICRWDSIVWFRKPGTSPSPSRPRLQDPALKPLHSRPLGLPGPGPGYLRGSARLHGGRQEITWQSVPGPA